MHVAGAHWSRCPSRSSMLNDSETRARRGTARGVRRRVGTRRPAAWRRRARWRGGDCRRGGTRPGHRRPRWRGRTSRRRTRTARRGRRTAPSRAGAWVAWCPWRSLREAARWGERRSGQRVNRKHEENYSSMHKRGACYVRSACV